MRPEARTNGLGLDATVESSYGGNTRGQRQSISTKSLFITPKVKVPFVEAEEPRW